MTAESEPAAATTVSQNSPSPRAPLRSRVLTAALAIAIVWILGLITLAVLTANPVTLNRMQIERSDYVVTATRKRADSAKIEVSREWKHGADLGEITVTNLDEARMPVDREFLVPLKKLASGRYLITPTTLPNDAPLTYPATEEAMEQLVTILKQIGT